MDKERLIKLWKKLKDLETQTIEFRREAENQLVELTGGAKERGATKLDDELTISFAESIEIDKGATITGALASVVRCKYELDRKAYAALSEADKLQVNESLTFKPKRPSFELRK